MFVKKKTLFFLCAHFKRASLVVGVNIVRINFGFTYSWYFLEHIERINIIWSPFFLRKFHTQQHPICEEQFNMCLYLVVAVVALLRFCQLQCFNCMRVQQCFVLAFAVVVFFSFSRVCVCEGFDCGSTLVEFVLVTWVCATTTPLYLNSNMFLSRFKRNDWV